MRRSEILDVLLLICFVATLVTATVAELSPDMHVEFMGRPLCSACLFRECFGVPCPFCGISRSMVAFMHGRIAVSLRFHPLGPFIALTFATCAALALWSLFHRARSTVESALFVRAFVLIAIAGLVLWPIRAFIGILPSAISKVP
jgi:hypothetical protein